MIAYLARRLLYMVTTLFFVSIIGFGIINLPPGTYLDAYIMSQELIGTHTAEREIEALTRQYGLDRPIYVQYWIWASGFVRGDFGRSFAYNREVKDLIWARIGYTIVLSVGTLFVTWALAIPIGIYSATHQYSLGDHALMVLGLLGLSIPGFMLALVLMVLAQRMLGLSVGGLFSPGYAEAPWSLAKLVDLLKHIWLPLIIVAVEGTAGLIRMMRGNLLDILNMQYVQAARARGLTERVIIVKHAVRNAIHPLIMILGMSLPGIISGATVISIVLNLPTTGPLYFGALRQQDMFLAGTFLMFMAIMLVIGNFAADLLLAWVDPRIRYE